MKTTRLYLIFLCSKIHHAIALRTIAQARDNAGAVKAERLRVLIELEIDKSLVTGVYLPQFPESSGSRIVTVNLI